MTPIPLDEIYRIAREALSNAFRHAEAQTVEAEVTYGDKSFVLRIRDDGRGIDPSIRDAGTLAGHWGIKGMRERAIAFGASLEVWSQLAAGTEVALTVPAPIAYGRSHALARFKLFRRET